ncbi:MAG: RagB/SusD family nutrient uptake outer membrane protein, partial [Bacteroides thetaiotaomicron]
VDETHSFTCAGKTQPWTEIRYAEVLLLNHAEACYHLSGHAPIKPIKTSKDIRNRVGASALIRDKSGDGAEASSSGT